MRRKQIGIAILAATMLVLTLLPGQTLAETGTNTIQEDYYVTHTISFYEGDAITITYTMEVADGPNIDVFFLDADNYRYFEDGEEFQYFTAGSDLDTHYTQKTITITEHGNYYLVFDNTDVGTSPPWNGVDDTAHVSWTIETEVSGGSSSLDSPGFEFPLMVGVILATIMFVAYRRGRE